MAYKVLPTDWTWNDIFNEFDALKYRRLTPQEIAEEMKLKQDVSMIPQKRGGSGFRIQSVYERGHNGELVRARIFLNVSGTTGRVNEKKWAYARLEHVSSDTYLSSPDILFTAGFPKRIKDCAKAFKDVVDHWPTDPECDHLMGFEMIPGVMHVRNFTCKTKKQGHVHRKRRTALYFLNIPISDQSRRFLKNMFEPSLKRIEKAIAEGETITPVRKKRADSRVPITDSVRK